MKTRIFYLFALLLTIVASLPLAQEISPKGMRLSAFLDSLHVENHWLAGRRVDWQTGNPDGKKYRIEGVHSHCSAFVAAACMGLGIYILRPPAHSTIKLAEAQCDWLETQRPETGWSLVENFEQAQKLANKGAVVIAVCRSKSGCGHGHIALVRPSLKNSDLVNSEGPDIIQAGIENYRCASLKEGFSHHAAAWKKGAIHFFTHTWKPNL
jgi:hypothetical protein